MSEHSAIEWTHHSFNPWWGCAKVSPGCDHCYAERDAKRFQPRVKLWGTKAEDAGRLVFDNKPKHWNAPLAWNKKAAARGVRERVFCASMADVFDNHPAVADDREELWTLIHKTPNLDWLLLTKRVGNVARMVPSSWLTGHWPAHVWLGISVVNQEEADRDIPKLLATPARIRFLSCEPMLGPIDIRGNLARLYRDADGPRKGIDWVIAGGESGPQARPSHPDWHRALRDQCAAAGVPFFFKQWGEWLPSESVDHPVYKAPHRFDGGMHYYRIGKAAAGRLLDGRTHDAFPA